MMTDSEEQQKIFQAFISACKKGEKNEHDMYMQKHEMSASSGQP